MKFADEFIIDYVIKEFPNIHICKEYGCNHRGYLLCAYSKGGGGVSSSSSSSLASRQGDEYGHRRVVDRINSNG